MPMAKEGKVKKSPLCDRSLEELAQDAAQGKEDCFSQLSRGFSPTLSRMISGLSVPAEEKEDLRQEGLIGLYKAVLLFDPAVSSFSNFARICMRSAILDGLRRYRRSGGAAELALSEELSLPSPGSDPQEILMGKERLSSLLEKASRSLSPLERRVFGLRLEGKRTQEIAKALSLSHKSVENALFRGRKKLSAQIYHV